MDDEEEAAVISAIFASAAVAAYVASADGRETRASPDGVYTIGSDQFEKAFETQANGWFVRMLRCEIDSFIAIVHHVQSVWSVVNGDMPCRKGTTPVMKRVALCLHYLASGSTASSASAVFGISHTRGVEYINEVLRALVHTSKSTISAPATEDNWAATAAGFEAIVSFPDVVGAVDGTLIRIARPAEYEGYKIWGHLLTPYAEEEAYQSTSKHHYNYCHSRTRILVERAFGSLKNRWRILLRKLDQKSELTLRNTIATTRMLARTLAWYTLL